MQFTHLQSYQGGGQLHGEQLHGGQLQGGQRQELPYQQKDTGPTAFLADNIVVDEAADVVKPLSSWAGMRKDTTEWKMNIKKLFS